jgi:hypothetical protein
MHYEIDVCKCSQNRAISMALLLVTLVTGLFAPDLARAQVPSTISYQGKLTTAAGIPVSDGVYSIAFRIYDDATGGNLFWEEVKSVTIKGGLFAVQLGETTLLDQSTLSIPNLFLAIKIGTNPESSPRTKLNAVPYASLVGTVQGALGGMIMGDLSATGQVSGSSNTGSGGYFQSYNTTTADLHGLTGKYSASTPFDGSGVYGYSKPGEGWGIGGEFEGGWIGTHGSVRTNGNGSLQYWGVMGDAKSSTPQLSASLFGVSGSASGALKNYGVYGSTTGVANSIGCSYYGLYGSATGTGPGSSNYGVYALASGGAGNIGILANGTPAGFFVGDVTISGSLSKFSGSFVIDHPLDPANKYLQHSFVESPDMMNIYNGIITLDADGKATVTMPDWFDALNREFRYQLTAIGAPGPNLFVAQKVINNQFSIAGGSAGLEVSWQVTGVRHDAWAEAHRIQVEVPKNADKAGTYLTPELFGMPETMGESYDMIQHAQEAAQQADQDRERRTAKRAVEVPKK